MSEWAQIIIAIATLFFSGSGIIGFWVWARAQILKMSNDLVDHRATVQGHLNLLKASVDEINRRCTERAPAHLLLDQKLSTTATEIYRKIDSLTTAVAGSREATAKDIGRLEGKVDSIIRN